MENRIPLEQAAVEVCDAAAVPPRIYQLPPEEGRKKLDEAQNAPVYKYPADISSYQVRAAEHGALYILYLPTINEGPGTKMSLGLVADLCDLSTMRFRVALISHCGYICSFELFGVFTPLLSKYRQY